MTNPPLELLACDHAPLCHGFRWQVVDEDGLAQLVAWVAVGRFNHAHRVITALQPPSPATPMRSAKQQAIARLTLAGSVTQAHRDGWVFQVISWIAACIQAGGNVATSIPHQQLAGKGFDGILIPLMQGGESFETITICEDKATDNPRSTMTQKVWPELKEIEQGGRAAELVSELTAILQRHQVSDVERLVESVQWDEKKRYRVSITVSASQSEDGQRTILFKGYDDVVNGPDVARRRAETLVLDKLRPWMDQFCKRVIDQINNL